jgi:hypothetical protein
MNEALNTYLNNEEEVCTNGYMYPIEENIPNSFFGADCQGWAKWRRRWYLFNRDGKSLLRELKERKLTREFDYDNSYALSRVLALQSKGLVNSWAMRWCASACPR